MCEKTFLIALLGLFFCYPINAQTDTVYNEVDRQPLFAGCEDELSSQAQQESCSLEKIGLFLSQNLVYPDSAKANKTSGLVLLRFVIDENGQISQIETLKNLENGCGKEALRVLRLMPNFSPAIKDGKKVACYMTLPVRFREIDEKTPTQGCSLHWGAVYGDKVSVKELTNLQQTPVEARDNQGNILKIKDLEISYIYKKRVKTAKIYSAKPSRSMQKMVINGKKGGILVLIARAETANGSEVVELARELEITD